MLTIVCVLRSRDSWFTDKKTKCENLTKITKLVNFYLLYVRSTNRQGDPGVVSLNLRSQRGDEFCWKKNRVHTLFRRTISRSQKKYIGLVKSNFGFSHWKIWKKLKLLFPQPNIYKRRGKRRRWVSTCLQVLSHNLEDHRQWWDSEGIPTYIWLIHFKTLFIEYSEYSSIFISMHIF